MTRGRGNSYEERVLHPKVEEKLREQQYANIVHEAAIDVAAWKEKGWKQPLRMDFFAEKNGEKYLVEVKPYCGGSWMALTQGLGEALGYKSLLEDCGHKLIINGKEMSIKEIKIILAIEVATGYQSVYEQIWEGMRKNLKEGTVEILWVPKEG